MPKKGTKKSTGRPPAEWTYNPATLAKLTGLSIDAIWQHRTRGTFDPDDLESVMLWLARHGRMDLRLKMVTSAVSRELPPDIKAKSKKGKAS